MKLPPACCLALCCCCVALPAAAELAQTPGAGVAFSSSADNEEFHMQRLTAEFLPAYVIADVRLGVNYSVVHYEQRSWARDARQIGAQFREIDPASATGWNIEGGVSSQNGSDLLTLDSSYRTLLTSRTGLDLFLQRDWVETASALDTGIHYTFGGIALDHSLTPAWTLAGVAGLQDFSDGNFRNHARGKLVYQPSPDLGFTLQLRYRGYVSSATATNYFNPDHYEETMLAAGWRQRLQGWRLNLTAGFGQQKVSGDPYTPTNLLEFDLQSPPFQQSQSFRIRASTSRSASYNGADYQYNMLQGEWILQL